MELNNLLKGNIKGRTRERRKRAGGLEGPVLSYTLLRPQSGSGHRRVGIWGALRTGSRDGNSC